MFKYGNFNKRYHTLDYYYKNKYNCKVFKVSLNLGLSCPNIDCTRGYGGCIYCKSGSQAFGSDKNKSLKRQFEDGKKILHKKWKNAKYIAYFQNNTNTYGDIDYLKKSFYEVLEYDNVVGINIATRCDAISEECFDLLCDLNKKTDLTVELGLQTIHEKTSKLINRGHTLEEFNTMYKKLKKAKIKVVVHIINGLPFETKEMMIETACYLNKLKVDGVKIHMLQVLKGTKLEKLYEKERFHILSKEEYIDIVTFQLENLNEDIVIHRITGDPLPEDLVAPLWTLDKFKVLNDIDKELKKRRTYQGFNLSILNRARLLFSINLKKNDLVIDATLGNGKDSLYLLSLIKEGFLFGFDISKEAILNSDNLLKDEFKNYKLYNISHDKMDEVLKDYENKISLVVFNLGYLPHSKNISMTNYKTTIKAIEAAIKLLNKKGHIVVTIYPGHFEGLKESLEIKKMLKTNNYIYKEYHNTLKETAPYVIDIKKSRLD